VVFQFNLFHNTAELFLHCSNGSGKTSLVFSILWALTGSLDPRPAENAKASDVVNDLSTVSFYRCEGFVAIDRGSCLFSVRSSDFERVVEWS
jgi:hypothetical protein